MSVSEAKLKANQENAKKSKGPKTESGKRKSAQNAVKHGIHAYDIIINSPKIKENQNSYDLLVASLVDELEPRSPLQEHLVHKIANCMWRYKRLITAETAEINKQLQPKSTFMIKKEDYYEHYELAGELHDLLNSMTIPTGDSADLFRRYEWRLNRELHHSYSLLRLLKIMAKVEEKQSSTQNSHPEPVAPHPVYGVEGRALSVTKESHSPQNHYNRK